MNTFKSLINRVLDKSFVWTSKFFKECANFQIECRFVTDRFLRKLNFKTDINSTSHKFFLHSIELTCSSKFSSVLSCLVKNETILANSAMLFSISNSNFSPFSINPHGYLCFYLVVEKNMSICFNFSFNFNYLLDIL